MRPKRTSIIGGSAEASVGPSAVSKYTGKTVEELEAMSQEERDALMDALPLDKQLALTREVRDLAEKYLVEVETLRDRGLAMYNNAQRLMDKADEKVFEVLRKMQKREDEASEQEDETDGH